MFAKPNKPEYGHGGARRGSQGGSLSHSSNSNDSNNSDTSNKSNDSNASNNSNSIDDSNNCNAVQLFILRIGALFAVFRSLLHELCSSS